MRIMMEPTTYSFTTDDGIPMQVWKGETNGGIGVTVFVSAVCTDPANQDELDAALEVSAKPHPGEDTPEDVSMLKATGRPEAADYDPILADLWMRARLAAD